MIPFGFIYLTTNLINSKQYIGQCKIKPGCDSYLGSGTFLLKSIKKYGRNNFDREILFYTFCKDSLSDYEKHFINLFDAVKNPNFYNIAEGGYSTRGFQGKTHSAEYKLKMKKLATERIPTISMKENMKQIGQKFGGFQHTEKHFAAITKIGKANLGKRRSAETRLKLSISHSKSKFIFSQIKAISVNGEELLFSNLLEVQDYFRIPNKTISSYLLSNRIDSLLRGNAKGWKFELLL